MRLALAVLLLAGVAEARDHGSITEGMDCGACHSAEGWKLAAGAGGGFDHARTGFPLIGGHRAVGCAGCHDGQKDPPRLCAGCHAAADPHARRLGDACEECHRPTAWNDTAVLERHRRTHLPLTGAHAVIDCTNCHAVATERTWSNVPWDCYACHARDYHRQDIHPLHDGANAFSHTCSQCHRTVTWGQAVIPPAFVQGPARLGLAAPQHDVRFALSYGKHRGLPCAGCHVAVDRQPRLVACTGCHAHDVASLPRQHHGRAVDAAPAGCLACHPAGARR
jgi:hypothetical protein